MAKRSKETMEDLVKEFNLREVDLSYKNARDVIHWDITDGSKLFYIADSYNGNRRMINNYISYYGRMQIFALNVKEVVYNYHGISCPGVFMSADTPLEGRTYEELEKKGYTDRNSSLLYEDNGVQIGKTSDIEEILKITNEVYLVYCMPEEELNRFVYDCSILVEVSSIDGYLLEKEEIWLSELKDYLDRRSSKKKYYFMENDIYTPLTKKLKKLKL